MHPIRIGKMENLQTRIMAVNCLTAIKREFTYNELIKHIKLPPPVLSRYVNGKVLPDLRRAEKILEVFENNFLNELICRKIKVNREGILDLSALHSDILLIGLIAYTLNKKFQGLKIDKVVCLDAGGEVLGTMISWFLRSPLITVRKDKELGVKKFIEHRFIRSPSVVEYLYLSRGKVVSGDRVLLIFDVIRTGKSAKALADLMRKVRSTVVGIGSIVALDRSISELEKSLNCYTYSILRPSKLTLNRK
jgi:adenine phosphoribosyltransferase